VSELCFGRASLSMGVLPCVVVCCTVLQCVVVCLDYTVSFENESWLRRALLEERTVNVWSLLSLLSLLIRK